MLSGGGAKGAYEVGVMKALYSGASPATGFTPLEAQIFTGTSVGAYNAAFMASRPRRGAEAITELETIWRLRIANTPDGCGNGIFRIRGLPLQGLDIGCLRRPVEDLIELAKDSTFFANFALVRGMNLITSQAPVRTRVAEIVDLSALFSVAPLDSLVRETISASELRNSENRLTVVASNWKEGKLKLFTKEDITERVGTAALLASAAIPGIFPPVEIAGTPYVDGGVLNNTPLRPAIRNGANAVHIIYLDPVVEDIPFPQLPNTLNTVYRMYAILQAANVLNDLNRARNVNRALEITQQRARPSFELNASDAVEITQLAARVVGRRRREGRPYRSLIIHRYRPVNDLNGGEGLLDFSSQNIESLIDLGYRDAVNHQCQASGCEIPDSGTPHLKEHST